MLLPFNPLGFGSYLHTSVRSFIKLLKWFLLRFFSLFAHLFFLTSSLLELLFN